MSSETFPIYALTARQLIKGLLPEVAINSADESEMMEELLLWPPDLFAFTSALFSLTGAYHLVVSPPKNEEVKIDKTWPPGPMSTDDWTLRIRQIGLEWRNKLEDNFKRTEMLLCKKAGLGREKRIREKVGYMDKGKWVEGSWVPQKLWENWTIVSKALGPKWERNIEEILCDESMPPTSVKKNWKAFIALLSLHAIADEACVGWGIRNLKAVKPDKVKWELISFPEEKKPESQKYAEELLGAEGTLSTINNQRGRVLPKRHTPGVGITLRSLSSNLAYHRSSVDVRWKVPQATNAMTSRMQAPDKTFSVLLLPWPLEISALDFRVETPDGIKLIDKYGFFSYSPSPEKDKWFNEELLKDVLDSARNETREIDMVVLPECALKVEDVKTLEKVLGSEPYLVSSYITGVRRSRENQQGTHRRFHDNMVYFKMGNLSKDGTKVTYSSFNRDKNEESDIQYKHHRWKLDRYQVANYSLGHILSPSKEWWEAIKIRRRRVTFINVGEELTICPLICEDLARQDPIADLMRTVGPSLVITILMDGPQNIDRWSARYASVLSEDPGSAVIALTSFGMVNRWHPPHKDPSRVIALWNDARGLAREIALEDGSVGVLLSLSVEGHQEPTADGRVESYNTNTVTLCGIHQIRPKKKLEEKPSKQSETKTTKSEVESSAVQFVRE